MDALIQRWKINSIQASSSYYAHLRLVVFPELLLAEMHFLMLWNENNTPCLTPNLRFTVTVWSKPGLKTTCGHLLSSTSHLTHDTRRCRWNWVGSQHEKVRAVDSLGQRHLPVFWSHLTCWARVISHHTIISVHHLAASPQEEVMLNTKQTKDSQ